MKDRISTEVLANGAIRYAEYDSAGNLVGYKYFKPADNPTEDGTPLNKATFLKDATAALLELAQADPTVDDALFKLGERAKIKMGSYVGTGVTAYSANPITVNTGLKPKIFIVYIEGYIVAAPSPSTSMNGFWGESFIMLLGDSGKAKENIRSTDGYSTIEEIKDFFYSASENGMTFYLAPPTAGRSISAQYTFNNSGTVYRWVAIG